MPHVDFYTIKKHNIWIEENQRETIIDNNSDAEVKIAKLNDRQEH